eukprot:3631994-Rhodomonas_salina.1
MRRLPAPSSAEQNEQLLEQPPLVLARFPVHTSVHTSVRARFPAHTSVRAGAGVRRGGAAAGGAGRRAGGRGGVKEVAREE